MMTETEKKRLRWQSRRGLLELDLILQPFLANDFEQLDEVELSAYQDLLMLTDNDLLDLVDGRSDVADERFRPLLTRLRRWQVSNPPQQ